jgi:hypothetical protein
MLPGADRLWAGRWLRQSNPAAKAGLRRADGPKAITIRLSEPS